MCFYNDNQKALRTPQPRCLPNDKKNCKFLDFEPDLNLHQSKQNLETPKITYPMII